MFVLSKYDCKKSLGFVANPTRISPPPRASRKYHATHYLSKTELVFELEHVCEGNIFICGCKVLSKVQPENRSELNVNCNMKSRYFDKDVPYQCVDSCFVLSRMNRNRLRSFIMNMIFLITEMHSNTIKSTSLASQHFSFEYLKDTSFMWIPRCHLR